MAYNDVFSVFFSSPYLVLLEGSNVCKIIHQFSYFICLAYANNLQLMYGSKKDFEEKKMHDDKYAFNILMF